jgi:hypothetical protein
MIVFGGKLSTRFNVSLIRDVVTWSHAVLFHNAKMSSCKTDRKSYEIYWRNL